jgi:hypothetical protein
MLQLFWTKYLWDLTYKLHVQEHQNLTKECIVINGFGASGINDFLLGNTTLMSLGHEYMKDSIKPFTSNRFLFDNRSGYF